MPADEILPERLTDVMSRLHIDLNCVLSTENRKQLLAASDTCRLCRMTAQCDDWIERHPEGCGSAPAIFCPVRAYLTDCEPRGDVKRAAESEE